MEETELIYKKRIFIGNVTAFYKFDYEWPMATIADLEEYVNEFEVYNGEVISIGEHNFVCTGNKERDGKTTIYFSFQITQ